MSSQRCNTSHLKLRASNSNVDNSNSLISGNSKEKYGNKTDKFLMDAISRMTNKSKPRHDSLKK